MCFLRSTGRIQAVARTAGSALLWVSLATTLEAPLGHAAQVSHVNIDLHESSGEDLADARVELSRLRGDGTTGETHRGIEVYVPYGTYRLQVFLGSTLMRSTSVRVSQPELIIPVGVSLLNCCTNLPDVFEIAAGEIVGKVRPKDEFAQYVVNLIPLWDSSFRISVKPDASGEFAFRPIDLGHYIVVLTDRDQVVEIKSIRLTEFNPVGRMELSGDR